MGDLNIKHYLLIQYNRIQIVYEKDDDEDFWVRERLDFIDCEVEIALDGRAWQDVLRDWKADASYVEIFRTQVIRREA